MKQAFKTAGFPRLYAGLTTSMFGDSVMLLVLSIWVKTLTGSSAMAGFTFFFMVIPSIFAPFAGVWIDRVRRKPLLVWGHVVSALAVAPLLLVRDESQVWIIYTVAFLYGVSFVVLPAGLNGLLKDLLPEDLLVDANGALQTTKESFRLLGPILGAGLFALLGAWPVVLLDAASFVVAGVVIATIRLTESAPEPDASHFLAQMADGLRHLTHDRVLAHVLVGFGLTMLVLGYTEASIYALLDSFGKPATAAGIFVSVMGIGAVAGGLSSAPIIRRIGEVAASVVSLVGIAVAVGGMVIASSMTVVILLTVPLGAAIPLFVVAYMTLLQRRTPQRLMGRVSATAEVIMATPQAISLAVGAVLVSFLDWRIIFAIMASVILASAGYIATMLHRELLAGLRGRASAQVEEGVGDEEEMLG
jgi:MFS family permease